MYSEFQMRSKVPGANTLRDWIKSCTRLDMVVYANPQHASLLTEHKVVGHVVCGTCDRSELSKLVSGPDGYCVIETHGSEGDDSVNFSEATHFDKDFAIRHLQNGNSSITAMLRKTYPVGNGAHNQITRLVELLKATDNVTVIECPFSKHRLIVVDTRENEQIGFIDNDYMFDRHVVIYAGSRLLAEKITTYL